MNKFRTLLIRFKSVLDLQKWYNLEFKNINKLFARNIRMNYRKSNRNEMVLYGYDKSIKFNSLVITQASVKNMLKEIDKMPLRKKDKEYRKFNKLNKYSLCGFNNKYPTEHCFTDTTHHTCCMLGRKAREYSNNSGNPIGKASEQSFKSYLNKKPLENDMTPWCTCIGSEVCSFYANKFNDGTHIKFINNDGIIAYNFDTNCEHNLKINFNYSEHRTPGISNKKKIKNKKCTYKSITLGKNKK